MESADIDEGSLQAVKSLRSKFERLASDTSGTGAQSLTVTAPANPRRRATSSSQAVAPPGQLKSFATSSDLKTRPADPAQLRSATSSSDLKASTTTETSHLRGSTSSSELRTTPPPDRLPLRGSTSSSDLKATLKRPPPPPPPPPRGSKIAVPSSPLPSPSPSLLLRPVPVPTPSNFVAKDSPAISSLKSKLETPSSPPSRIASPRPSDQVQLETKPVVPPRPVSLLSNARQQIDNRAITASPFSDDELPSVADPAAVSEAPASRITTPRQSASFQRPVVPPRPSSLLPPARANNDTTTERETSNLAPSSPIPSSLLLRPVPVPSTKRSDPPGPFPDEEQDVIQPIPLKAVPPPIPNRQHADNNKAEPQSNDDSERSSRLIPPPRPPPRHFSVSAKAASLPVSKVSSPAPALPVRRSTILGQEQATVTSLPPPLPNRSQMNADAAERKAVGSSKLPPPPTRTIGLGDKLPPPRRPTTPSSDEDSGEEDEPKVQAVDLMPDSSTSSRRPPVLGFHDGYTDHRIHVHLHSGCEAISGSHVMVGHGHHIKIYDLAVSETPAFTVDTKDLGLKDSKVTCMEIRPTISKQDHGFLVWVGTKEGHIFELDIRNGSARGTKYAAHLYPVAHLFRHGRSMVSLDESGKTLIFSPDPADQQDISLFTTTPRVMRTTDKQDFVRMIDGKLWTAARTEHHGVGRLPVIRVYDVFNPAAAGRSVLPTDHVGAVTSATILPTQPRMVYVGHEEGFVSLWALDTEDGFPACVEVMKVSASDVLSLEGVNDRLWAGSRNGMISAYNVAQTPWVVTNCWSAHSGVPVVKLMVNYFAMAQVGRLCVASIGKDDHMRVWDGLLGSDWIDKELVKKETSFSSFRDLTVLVVSWNCDSARPDSLTGENESFLSDALHSVDHAPDVIVFGLQEVIDLESRKMAAKSVILGGKKKPEDGGLSDRVTGAYKRWYDRLIVAVKAAMPKDMSYCVVHTESLVGLFSCIFVKNSERGAFDDVSITTIKRGMGGRYGNKGGIVARFVIGDSSICFINCHLAAGQKAVRRRNADIASILEEKAVFAPAEHPVAYVGGGDGTMVLDHEFVILNGDLNYRIDHRREPIIAAINTGDLATLHLHDQLLREIKLNRGCRLRGFSEGVLKFNPTYKYDPRSDEYDTSEKRRLPAWCDRVLWRSRVPARVRQLHYRRYEVNVSDHRPISAAFAITVKTFDHEGRESERAILRAAWVEEQRRFLDQLHVFYKNQALI